MSPLPVVRSSPARVHGWGRTAPALTELVRPTTVDEAVAVVRAAAGRPRGLTPRGLGRSYGDAAQNSGGTTVDLTGLDQILALDVGECDAAASPTVRVEAGVSLDALMKALLPFGLWVPVLPGTRQVTVGGAIGADVHGKNHHTQGSFGNHVRSLDLLTADGEIRTVAPDGDDPDLFWATVGGMALTGLVLRATIVLQRVQTAYFSVDTDRCHDVDDLMARMTDGDSGYTYSVAWFDAVTRGTSKGRAVLTRGNKAALDALPAKLRSEPLRFVAPSFGTVPDVFPNHLVNRLTGKVFSEFWFRKAPKHRVAEIQNITQFFHPLDIISDWNRGYGSNGFLQYQFVVPFAADQTFRECLDLVVSSTHASCLNVLKRLGPANPSPLSFPTPGWTFTVDLPIEPGLAELCNRLDELVLDVGGRIYLAKDSRVAASTFASMYPRLDDFRAVRRRVDPSGAFTSDLARRLDL